NRDIAASRAVMESYKHFFDEPYFARMDAKDDKEGYNVYYIGKKGDLNLGIVDWRAPLARRYYQKSQRHFSINESDYEVILRRAIRTYAGRIAEFTNEHLSVRDYLSKEEIAGRDAEIVLDPYLREIIRARKDEESVKDIIETIQEKQFDLITRPERENFVVQGCAGSGKTMVLLHRLSYLMYNNEELSPRDVLVITPSRSFNAFIDELSQVLELEKVRTFTLQDYFTEVLSKAGVDVADNLNGEKESIEYLSYLYSEQYPLDVEKTLKKVYDDVYGLFASEECKAFALQVLADCREQREEYTRIKNATTRLRRVILGEIKETPEGGLRYTRPFRDFMNRVLQVEDFLSLGAEEGVKRSQAYFYHQLALFYGSALKIAGSAEKIISDTLTELENFTVTVEKEIKELKRYRYRVGGREEYTYPDRIAAREELLKETGEWRNACAR
ncbi:MAG: UvrD-helicase domain-containing protein, partial [Clostridia bacterium]|nr:UvrD-helicase domain-containing protein [Clostridia bacterium]